MGKGKTSKTLVIQLSLPADAATSDCLGRLNGPGWLRFVRGAGGRTSDSGVNRWVTANYRVQPSRDCPNGCNENIMSCSNNDGTLM